MITLEIVFWVSLALVGYTYLGYPLLLWVCARARPAPTLRRPFTGSISIVLAARNEEETIARRLEELCLHLKDSGLAGEVVLVSDGSTDGTAAGAEDFVKTGLVRVLELPVGTIDEYRPQAR